MSDINKAKLEAARLGLRGADVKVYIENYKDFNDLAAKESPENKDNFIKNYVTDYTKMEKQYKEESKKAADEQAKEQQVEKTQTNTEIKGTDSLKAIPAFDSKNQQNQQDPLGAMLMSGGPGMVKAYGSLDTFTQYFERFSKAHSSGAQTIAQIIQTFYGTPQDQAIDQNYNRLSGGEIGDFQAGLKGELGKDPQQLQQPQRQDNTVAIASQMALAMLGDFMQTSIGSRAPAQTVSSSVIGQVADSEQKQRDDFEMRRRDVEEKNAQFIVADNVRRMAILKSLSETEKSIMMMAMQEYQMEASVVNNSLNTMMAGFQTETQNKNNYYNRLLQADIANSQSRLGMIKAMASAQDIKVKERQLKNEEVKLRLTTAFPEGSLDQTRMALAKLGGDPTIVNRIAGLLPDYIHKLPDARIAIGNYKEAIMKAVKRATDDIWLDKNKNYFVGKYFNTIGNFAARGLVVDPDLIIGGIDVLNNFNTDTGARFYDSENITKFMNTAVRASTNRDTLSHEQRKDLTAAVMMHFDNLNSGGEGLFKSDEDLNSVITRIQTSDQTGMMNENQPLVASYGTLAALQAVLNDGNINPDDGTPGATLRFFNRFNKDFPNIKDKEKKRIEDEQIKKNRKEVDPLVESTLINFGLK